ncbi:protein of unknown function [Modestobacter italicus]|uniref:Uncharacterized protein n=1 Tax=Modestobacter italicus (strain DSM 44449 / CECT 9708 / BC 501) TaxID=2732864 RepID=I4F0C8_MODI5|nr:protein of unknown function [Modestobacter marinus]
MMNRELRTPPARPQSTPEREGRTRGGPDGPGRRDPGDDAPIEVRRGIASPCLSPQRSMNGRGWRPIHSAVGPTAARLERGVPICSCHYPLGGTRALRSMSRSQNERRSVWPCRSWMRPPSSVDGIVQASSLRPASCRHMRSEASSPGAQVSLEGSALPFGQSTPDSVSLVVREGLVKTSAHDRARGAHVLRRASRLTSGREEHLRVDLRAQCSVLPQED